MKYFYLLTAGILISSVHFYLVWHHRDKRKYSISEHAILTRKSHALYFASHLVGEVLLLLFAYQFFVTEQGRSVLFYMFVSFAVFDFLQVLLPSKGRTEKVHFVAAYIAWCSYLLAGVLALISITLAEPYSTLATILLVPILGMFFYMHINRSKLYPYQLAIVPLFVVFMLLVTVGAS